MNNRRVRSMMRKPKYSWRKGFSMIHYYIDEPFWPDAWTMGQSNRSGRPVRRQLLHKGKKV